MPDTQPAIPAEAVEAALDVFIASGAMIEGAEVAEVRAAFEAEPESLAAWRTGTASALAAALPHLAQYVSPSREQIAAEVDAEAVSYRAVTDHGQHAEPLTKVSGSDFADVIADRVFALLSATPTVEQVRRETREQVAREIEALEPDTHDPFDSPFERGYQKALNDAARIARAVEEVDRG